MKKKWLAKVLVFLIVFSLATVGHTGSQITAYASDFTYGDGSETDPWQISTPEELNSLRNYLGPGHVDKHFALANDIDLSAYLSESGAGYNGGAGWIPIGDWSYENAFYGDFNGNGHTINGLFMDWSSDGDNSAGLFGGIIGASVRNLALSNVDVSGPYEIGGLAGYAQASAITNVVISGTVTGTLSESEADSARIGGLIGILYSECSITNAHSSVQVEGTPYSYEIGGLVGLSRSGCAIINSSAAGSTSGYTYVGGLVGYNGDDSVIAGSRSESAVTGTSTIGGLAGENNNSVILNSFAAGNVSGHDSSGGLVGCNFYSRISGSYAVGDVATSGGDCTGGLVGSNNYNSEIANSYARGAVNGVKVIGGLVASNAGGSTVFHSYATGPVTGATLHVGGLIGYNYMGGPVTDSYYFQPPENYIGTFSTEEAMKLASTYATWDFDDIWGIQTELNSGFPFLQWQTFVPQLRVTGIRPDWGTNDQTSFPVSIEGTCFEDGAAVELNFDGTEPIAGENVHVVGDTGIACAFDLSGVTTHLGAAWDVKVTNPDTTTATGLDLFTLYRPNAVVDRMDPSSGDSGTTIAATITGTNFVSGLTSITLNKTGCSPIPATDVSVTSPSSLTCTFDLTGASGGLWDIRIAVDGAMEPTTLTDGFTVTGTPLPAEISYDDGSAESSWHMAGADGCCLVRFSPPAAPVILTRLSFYDTSLGNSSSPSGAKALVINALGEIIYEGEPFYSWDGGWNHIDLPSATIGMLDGDFYAGFKMPGADDGPYCGYDTDDPVGNRSYSCTSYEGSDDLASLFPINGGDLMIRASVDEPPNQAPAFLSPDSTTFTAGEFGSFTLETSGYPCPSIALDSGTLPGGVTFSTESAILSGTPAVGTGGSYPLTFSATNSTGSASQSFTLNVNEAPNITGQPQNVAANPGETAAFTVTYTAHPAASVQWQLSTKDGRRWSDIPGATGDTYTTPATTTKMDGYQSRAIVSNAVGDPVLTDAAILTVRSDVFTSTDIGVEMQEGSYDQSTNTIRWDLTVSNIGDASAENVKLTNVLAKGTRFSSIDLNDLPGISYKVRGTAIDVDIGELASGSSVTITIHAEVTRATSPVENTASVSTTSFDPNLDNNTATATCSW